VRSRLASVDTRNENVALGDEPPDEENCASGLHDDKDSNAMQWVRDDDEAPVVGHAPKKKDKSSSPLSAHAFAIPMQQAEDKSNV
jgi:hypothetical protein